MAYKNRYKAHGLNILYMYISQRKFYAYTSLTWLCEYEVSSAVLRASVAIALRLHRAEHCDCVCVCEGGGWRERGGEREREGGGEDAKWDTCTFTHKRREREGSTCTL